ncbi:uncharacterized protein MELLADRAFT_68247 [Melampsora larici-populina 98AG31]|uniref:Secreted protein n=1 Tax=Melampsora larici-populina (strain 98AG31 / pathotype 3-4-7) TaxID=747676 RepID=F4S638_MELLP|nr:uncharacterized protein MELLADRAFT_68247 [Melampsora larici-populina 98AG31]EGF99868.1 hypothetical protein MELLADRAFT_68247 [Melampsora larici-populina 98AG31]
MTPFTLRLFTLFVLATEISCSPMENVSQFNLMDSHAEAMQAPEIPIIQHCGNQAFRVTDNQGYQFLPLDSLSDQSGSHQETISSRTILPFDLNFPPDPITKTAFKPSTQEHVGLKSFTDDDGSPQLSRELDLNSPPDSTIQPSVVMSTIEGDARVESSMDEDGSQRLQGGFKNDRYSHAQSDPHTRIPLEGDTQKREQSAMNEGYVPDDMELDGSSESFDMIEDIPSPRVGKSLSAFKQKKIQKSKSKDKLHRSQEYVFVNSGRVAKISNDRVNMIEQRLYVMPGTKYLARSTRNIGIEAAVQEKLYFGKHGDNSWFQLLYKDMEVNNRELNPNLDNHLAKKAQNAVHRVYHEVTTTFFGVLVLLYPHSKDGKHTSIRSGWEFITNLLEPWRTIDWQDSYRALSIISDAFDINDSSLLLSYTMNLGRYTTVSLKLMWKMTEKWKSQFSYHSSEQIGSLSDFCKKLHTALKKKGAFPNSEIALLDPSSSLERSIPSPSVQAVEATTHPKKNLTHSQIITACVDKLKNVGQHALKHLKKFSLHIVEQIFERIRTNVQSNQLDWPMDFEMGFEVTLNRAKRTMTYGFIGVLQSLHPSQELADGTSPVVVDGLKFLVDFMKNWDSSDLLKALSTKKPNLEAVAETHDPSILLSYLIRLTGKNYTYISNSVYWGLYKSWEAWTELSLENKKTFDDSGSFWIAIQERLL